LEDYPFALENGEPATAACDARLDPALHGPSRLRALLVSVIDEVERKLGALSQLPAPLRVYLSVPQPRPGISHHEFEHLARIASAHLEAKGVNAFVAITGHGHAGAMLAVQQAMQAHARGEDVPTIILGVESYLDPQTLLWLDRQRLLAQPSCPNGFIPGEGAGCLVLASARLRKHAGWPCQAVLRGIGIGQEPHLRDSELGSLGEGMTEAVLQATASLSGAEVDTAYIDVNGERYRSEEWGFVVLRTPELWRSLEYEAPSACWGDVGAAWATLAGVLAVRSFARAYARGPRALVMAGSLNGLRGAMLLQDPRSR
jgi:3-oxoacyl-[acyl-carrier-protein] synthase-1